MLIDSHCHLEMNQYNQDRAQVIARAIEGGIGRMVTVGTSPDLSRRAVEIAQAHPAVFATVGIHPHDVKEATADDYRAIRDLARHPKVLAYGEIGLDFFKDYSPRPMQRDHFRRQIRLARELDLPLIIHDRDAHEETLKILLEEGDRYCGVFHCFAGDEDFARRVVDLGFHISFTGTITYAKAGQDVVAHRVIQQTSLDKLLVETDAPYLTPTPYRGKRNEPAHVRYVAEKIAELKGLSVEEIARQTTLNAYRLFRFETKGMTPAVVYEHKNALYINLTSRCTNHCSFCAKFPDFLLGGHYLYLEPQNEPTVEQVLAAIPEPAAHNEIVFCGFGEPTLRWADLLTIAKQLKKRGARRIRLNTNGHADLINKRPVAKEMKGAIDAVSVSLNAADAAMYQQLCGPSFGTQTYAAITDFIGQAKRYVPEVTVSAVAVEGLNIEAVRRLAETMLGVAFRRRG